jgi:hypothetical protein
VNGLINRVIRRKYPSERRPTASRLVQLRHRKQTSISSSLENHHSVNPRKAKAKPVRVLMALSDMAAPGAGGACGVEAGGGTVPFPGAPVPVEGTTLGGTVERGVDDDVGVEAVVEDATGPPCGPYAKLAQAIRVLFG